MKKFLTFVSALLFVAVATLSAQTATEQPPVKVGDVVKLITLTGRSGDKVKVNPCGPYFRYTDEQEKNKVGMLLSMGTTAEGEMVILPWRADKFQIRLDNSAKTPTIKVLHVGGPVYPWAEIVISSSDLKKAPCLSHVDPLPSVIRH